MRGSDFDTRQLYRGHSQTAAALTDDSLTETTEGAGEAVNYHPEDWAVARDEKTENCVCSAVVGNEKPPGR